MARKKSPEANLEILQEKFVKIVVAQTHSCIVGQKVGTWFLPSISSEN